MRRSPPSSGDWRAVVDVTPLAALEDLAGYRALFADAAFWAPYVRLVCRRHQLGPGEAVRMGVPGTYPTFIADDRWVVKFFGRLFDGAAGFAAELEAGRLLAQATVTVGAAVPAAAVLAHGALIPEAVESAWRWPYIVFEYVPGVSIGEVYAAVPFAEKARLACDLGMMVRRLHALPLHDSAIFPPSWEGYRAFLHEQRLNCRARFRAAGVLPRHLLDQVDGFLAAVGDEVAGAPCPHLIHADLTDDHVLGELRQGRWITRAIIDFGDAMVGNWRYELVALHCDLFHCDRRLLAVFLHAYGLRPPDRRTFWRTALAATLLHRFGPDCLRLGFDRLPSARQAATLDELGRLIWDPEPGADGG